MARRYTANSQRLLPGTADVRGVVEIDGQDGSNLLSKQSVVSVQPLDDRLDRGTVGIGPPNGVEETRVLIGVCLDSVGVKRCLVVAQLIGGIIVHPREVAGRVGVEMGVARRIGLQSNIQYQLRTPESCHNR